MANTTNKNVIVPEVYSQLVMEKVSGRVKVAQFAENLGNLIDKEVGETITFPVWSYIGDASDIAIGSPMDAVEMEQKDSTATIKMIAAPAVKVFDYDNMTALGRAIDEAGNQQGISIARKLDTDCIHEAVKTPFKAQLANKDAVTEAELLDALAMYGDDRDTADFHAIVCHSVFAKSFYMMDGFMKSDITHTKDGNGIVENGTIGAYMGIPVVLSDRCYDVENQEGFLMFIKKGALGYMPKEQPFIEFERIAKERSTIVYCSQVYAVKLVDEAGIVVAKSNTVGNIVLQNCGCDKTSRKAVAK